MRQTRALGVALAAAGLLASTAPSPPQRSVLVEDRADTILILPLNVTFVMPGDLEGLSPIIWSELERYLRASGKQLRTVAFDDARRLWVASVRKARSGEPGPRASFDDAARLLVVELRQHAEFDYLIVPSLYIQKAPIQGRRAFWDGVKRDLEIDAHSFQAKSIAAAAPLEGVAPAASLHAVVLDAEGNKVHESRGGLELLVRIQVRTPDEIAAGQPTFEFETRTDLFANKDHLREGIAEALGAFVPPILME